MKYKNLYVVKLMDLIENINIGEMDLIQKQLNPQKSIYKSFSEIAKLQSDKMRLEHSERPISEVITILNEKAEESDLG